MRYERCQSLISGAASKCRFRFQARRRQEALSATCEKYQADESRISKSTCKLHSMCLGVAVSNARGLTRGKRLATTTENESCWVACGERSGYSV